MLGPTQRYVLLNDRLSLVCGTGLDSNPPATIAWTTPDGNTIIMDNARYNLDNGPDVRLNFMQVVASDIGIWQCDVTVMSERYIVSNSSLVLEDHAIIGTPIVHFIQLIAVGELFQAFPLEIIVSEYHAERNCELANFCPLTMLHRKHVVVFCCFTTATQVIIPVTVSVLAI